MYILSNKEKTLGAAVILYDQVLKTAGEEIIDAIYSKQCILIAILDWTEKNADKLQ